jgi:hypothetical protein
MGAKNRESNLRRQFMLKTLFVLVAIASMTLLAAGCHASAGVGDNATIPVAR